MAPPGAAAASQAAAGTYAMLVGKADAPQCSPQCGTPGSPIAAGGCSPNAGGGHAVDAAAASRPPHAPIGQPSAMRPGGGPPLGKAAAACDGVSRPHALPAAAEFFATDTRMGLSTPGGQWRSLSVAIAAAAISCAVRVWNQMNPHLWPLVLFEASITASLTTPWGEKSWRSSSSPKLLGSPPTKSFTWSAIAPGGYRFWVSDTSPKRVRGSVRAASGPELLELPRDALSWRNFFDKLYSAANDKVDENFKGVYPDDAEQSGEGAPLQPSPATVNTPCVCSAAV